MNKLKAFAGKQPLGFAFLSILLLLVLMGGPAAIAVGLLEYELTDVEPQVIGQIVATSGFLFLLWRLEWLGPAGITRSGSRRLWLTTLLVLLYTGVCALLAFFGALRVDLSLDSGMVPVLAHTTLAGVMEEVFFRGLILYVLLAGWGGSRRGIITAVSFTASICLPGLTRALWRQTQRR